MLEMFVLFLILGMVNFSLQVSHPLVLGAGLLTVLVAMSSVIVFYGSLFSFCLFMTIVGGVLVVFSYTISLIPFSFESEGFGSSNSEKFLIMIGFLFSGLLFGGILLSSYIGNDWSYYNLFSDVMYFSGDWSIFIVWMSLLLFLVMIFSVSVAGKYSGALLK